MQAIPVFKCNMCGECCKLSPISLLPHEGIVLRELSEIIGVEVKFTPGYTVYDAISGVNIAFSYILHLNENSKCPFLLDNKCSIHYIYKPYICRSFPYIPRHVRYSIDDVNRYITAEADYGLSLACYIVRRDKEVLEKYSGKHSVLVHYLRDEYLASVEAENIRLLLLYLLSVLWREGLVNIKPSVPGARVISLYEFLRSYFPELPSRLNLDKVLVKVRKWSKNY
ncbi:MAG: YkgJ family cysteine cluster protein [Desulfurococcaceae archaeon]|nr:YkgJ family cysteine cluster protein [Desulfurococcaceae archaeon]